MGIVASTDHKFVMPTGVMLLSVCYNNQESEITFHIIVDASVTENDKHDLSSVLKQYPQNRIQFYMVDSQKLSVLPSMGVYRTDLTLATYYRLWLSELLPDTLNKVLYLDGDVIVRRSLLPLWDIDLTDYAVAAVPDKTESWGEKYDRLGYSAELGYFNAGVMMINLDYWRRGHVIDNFVNMLMNRPQAIVCYDQDVLNYCFREKKLHLPIKYNMQDGYLYIVPGYDYQKYEAEVLEARKDPVIVHYTNGKPWYTYNRHQHPWRSLFFKYCEQTIWKDEPLWEMRSLKMRLIKRIAVVLRRWKIIPELPPNGYEYIDIPPID